MKHVLHIIKNKQKLELRFAVLKLIREWFARQGFTEVDAPQIVSLPGQEPNIEPMKLAVHNEKGQSFTGYLHTSPEYAMKKMLAAGFDKIFYLGKCFRDRESFGYNHNPEFTMLEWYRAKRDFRAIMDDTESLCRFVANKVSRIKRKGLINVENVKKMSGKWERVSMRELWKKFVGVELNDFLTAKLLRKLCVQRGFKPAKSEDYEELFYRIFLNEVEPKLGVDRPIIVYNYPACMASLSSLCKKDKRYAERFEVYFAGSELANAFTELTHADEQLARLTSERIVRRKRGMLVYDVDREFIEALRFGFPQSACLRGTLRQGAAGIALGVDRLIMSILGCKNIDDVIVFPMSKLWNNEEIKGVKEIC